MNGDSVGARAADQCPRRFQSEIIPLLARVHFVQREMEFGQKSNCLFENSQVGWLGLPEFCSGLYLHVRKQ
jgi:hypothetical protein